VESGIDATLKCTVFCYMTMLVIPN